MGCVKTFNPYNTWNWHSVIVCESHRVAIWVKMRVIIGKSINSFYLKLLYKDFKNRNRCYDDVTWFYSIVLELCPTPLLYLAAYSLNVSPLCFTIALFWCLLTWYLAQKFCCCRFFNHICMKVSQWSPAPLPQTGLAHEADKIQK